MRGFVSKAQLDVAAPHLERLFDQWAQLDGRHTFGDPSDDCVDAVFLEPGEWLEIQGVPEFAIHEQGLDAVLARAFSHFGMKAFAGFDKRCQQMHGASPGLICDGLGDGRGTLFDHGHITLRAILRTKFRKQQAQEMPNFSHRRHRRLAATTRDALFNGHCRRNTRDQIDLRLLHLLHKSARIHRHAVKESALPLGKHEIKGQR